MHDRRPYVAGVIGGLVHCEVLLVNPDALRRLQFWRLPQRGLPHPVLATLPNGHLHLGLLVALLVAAFVALTVPISSTEASDARRIAAPSPPSGLAVSLTVQAQTVTSLLTSTLVSDQSVGLPALTSLPGAGLIPDPLVEAAAKIAAGGALGSSPAFAVPPQYYVPFTLHQNGFASSQYAAGLTVGDALSQIGVQLGADDLVSPPLDSLLTPGLHIYVQHASTVRLILEGKEQIVTTRANSVGELLSEVGFRLEPTDRVFPPPNDPIGGGITVNVTTFRAVREFQDTPIDFDTVFVFDGTLPVGESVLLEEGSPGYLRREFHVVTVNGREIQRELISERVLLPRDQVVAVGTYEAPPPPPPAPRPPFVVESPQGELDCARTLTVWATWYTAASAGGNGITASGTPVYRGIVAVDPNVIPLGTRMYIPGYGFGLAADTGGGVIGNHIDLGFGADDVVDWRTGYVDICILN